MRVLVADDHSLFRDGIVSLLEAAGFEVVGQVGDGQAAVSETQRLRPDMVLLDISMPLLSGLEALRQIRATIPGTEVVMLTVSEEEADLYEAIKGGACGYLLKSLNAEEFLDMLHGIQHGEAALTRETTSRLMKGFAHLAHQQEQETDLLTPRELELLQLVADGHSNKAIAKTLSVSVNTVKYHMKNILQKMGAQNRTEAVTLAIRTGLLMPDSSN